MRKQAPPADWDCYGLISSNKVCVHQVRQPEIVKVANHIIERLGKSMVTAELLHPDELVSGMISQIAATPEMAELLAAFIYTYEGMAAPKTQLHFAWNCPGAAWAHSQVKTDTMPFAVQAGSWS